ncbi:MAG: hypothetical protein RIT27_1666 [Pseudomonadota bacterium]|jgi:hypothetical protein
MDYLAEIPFSSVELRWLKPLTGQSEQRIRQLRGAIANVFTDDPRFHQHDAQGKPLYRYPQIQYRWRNGYGIIAGWGNSAETLLNTGWLDLELALEKTNVQVYDALISTKIARFGISERLLRYKWVSPILLFNQKNYAHYQKLNEAEKTHEIERLLIANLLSALKGLEIYFPAVLYATFLNIETQPCQYKQQTLLGISGEFITNAILPNDFAFGHAVSHGYGWIEKKD